MRNIMMFALTALTAVIFTACQAAPVDVKSAANTNAANTNAAKPAASAPTIESLMTLERSAYDAWKNKDAKFWNDFLSDSFVGYGIAGKLDKAAAMKEYAGADCDVKSVTLSDERMMPLGADAAVITYKTMVDATCGGQKLPAQSWAAGVYVRSGSQWKGAFHAETAVVDPKAPAKPATKAPEQKAAAEAKTDAVTEALIAAEKKIWEAWKLKDTKGVDDSLGKDFVYLSGGERADRTAVLKTWGAENKCDVKSYTFTQPTSVMLTKDVALLTFNASVDGKCEGKSVPDQWTAALYTKTGETWMPAFGMGL